MLDEDTIQKSVQFHTIILGEGGGLEMFCHSWKAKIRQIHILRLSLFAEDDETRPAMIRYGLRIMY